MTIFPAPTPETVLLLLRGDPPLMLTPAEFAPAPVPAPATEAACSPPELPLALGLASGAPPGTPGFRPSGEIATRAARFPAGETTGAGGPGVAERAISVCSEPFGDVSCAATSGAGSASASCLLWATRGAAPVLSCTFGRSGPTFVIARFNSAARCSGICTSGSGAAALVAMRRLRGRNFLSTSWLISRRGRAGAADCASCTMFGRSGSSFGGSGGAAVLIRVCRGCVG